MSKTKVGSCYYPDGIDMSPTNDSRSPFYVEDEESIDRHYERLDDEYFDQLWDKEIDHDD